MSKNYPKPVEPVEALDEVFEDEIVVEEVIAEPAVEPLEVVATSKGSYKLVEGDSWALVAAKHPSSGKTKHQRAVELAEKYGSAAVGKVIELV